MEPWIGSEQIRRWRDHFLATLGRALTKGPTALLLVGAWRPAGPEARS